MLCLSIRSHSVYTCTDSLYINIFIVYIIFVHSANESFSNSWIIIFRTSSKQVKMTLDQQFYSWQYTFHDILAGPPKIPLVYRTNYPFTLSVLFQEHCNVYPVVYCDAGSQWQQCDMSSIKILLSMYKIDVFFIGAQSFVVSLEIAMFCTCICMNRCEYSCVWKII